MAVFVIKPAGYAVPLDEETRLPRFSYIHQPEGTPSGLDLLYPGLAPTGPLPESVDFALIKTKEPRRFDAVLFTDPQPESHAEIDFIRDDVAYGLNGIEAAFGITAGDIMFDDLSLYGRYNRIIGQIGLPWWNIGGNHDLNFEAPSARYCRETFKRVFGANYYAFEYGDTLFLMLDNVDYLGADPAKPAPLGQIPRFFWRAPACLRRQCPQRDGQHAPRRRLHAHSLAKLSRPGRTFDECRRQGRISGASFRPQDGQFLPVTPTRRNITISARPTVSRRPRRIIIMC